MKMRGRFLVLGLIAGLFCGVGSRTGVQAQNAWGAYNPPPYAVAPSGYPVQANPPVYVQQAPIYPLGGVNASVTPYGIHANVGNLVNASVSPSGVYAGVAPYPYSGYGVAPLSPMYGAPAPGLGAMIGQTVLWSVLNSLLGI